MSTKLIRRTVDGAYVKISVTRNVFPNYFKSAHFYMKGFVSSDVHGNSEMAADRPFATKPSHDLLFIKLWAASLRMPEMEKACQKY